MDLALNNLQRLIFHKTQQTKSNQLDRNTWNQAQSAGVVEYTNCISSGGV